MDETTLRRGIGYVIQQVGLFPHMTVAENIATVPKLLGWSKREIEQRTDELLDPPTCPPATTAPLRGAALRRRAPAGRARPGAGGRSAADVDGRALRRDRPDHADAAQDELLRIQRELRKTIIFVTHDIDEAILVGDRIAILREGGVLAQYDSPERLLAHPADDFVARFVGADRGPSSGCR